jgi:hypothetical protein
MRTCRIDSTGLDVAAEWIAERHALWERRLDRLGDVLTEEEPPIKQLSVKQGEN